MKKAKLSHWDIVKRFFDSKVSGKIFTRSEYMNHMTNHGCYKTTVPDTYRNTLERAGYITVPEPGVYRKLKKIPKGLSITKALIEGKDRVKYDSSILKLKRKQALIRDALA